MGKFGKLSAMQLNEVCWLYAYGQWSMARLARDFGITLQAVSQLLTRRHVAHRPPERTLTETQRGEICSRYQQGELSAILAKEFHVDRTHITDILRQYSITRRRNGSPRLYACDHAFFHEINTEAKAYWLGFLAADGSIYNARISLSLAMQDSKHVYRFSDAIHSNHPIIENIINSRGYKNAQPLVRLVIFSPQMAADLAQYSLVPNKTFLLRWPNIPEEYLHHFVRGYFDGDGSFSISYHGNHYANYTFGITSNTYFLEELQRYLMRFCNLPLSKLYQYPRLDAENPTRSLLYTGRLQCSRIYDLLYADATVYLLRKFEKFAVLFSTTSRSQGALNHLAKLTDEDIQNIRTEATTTTGVALAQRFGVSTTTISRILQGKTWKHIL